MSLEELKPCPFCGHETARRPVDAEELLMSASSGQSAIVCCFHNGGCGASGGFTESDSLSAEKWNKRSPTTGAKQ